MTDYELTDILLFIKSIRTSNNSFDITEFISFSSSNTRSLGTKLCHRVSINNITLNSYFLDYLDFGTLFPSLTFPSHMIQSKGN